MKLLNLSPLPCTNQGHRKEPCYLKLRGAITIIIPHQQASLNGLLSSWSPFQESESGEEQGIPQHLPSPLFQNFDIKVQDSKETTLIQPLHNNIKAADLYGPFPSSVF